MLKKSHVPLFLLLLCFAPLAAQKKPAPDWPGVAYNSATVYLYNIDNQLHEHYQAWKDGEANYTILKPGTELNPAQVKKLLTVLNSDTRMLNEGLAKCYEPHHAVFFHDTTGKTVAAFDICFLCEGIKFYPAKAYKSEITNYSEALTKKAEKQLEEIKTVFTEAGIPIFTDREKTRYYSHPIVKQDSLVLLNNAVFDGLFKTFPDLDSLQRTLKDFTYTIDSSSNNYYVFTGKDIDLHGEMQPNGFSIYQKTYPGIEIYQLTLTTKNAALLNGVGIGMKKEDVYDHFKSFTGNHPHHNTLIFEMPVIHGYGLAIHFNEQGLTDQINVYLTTKRR